MNQVEIQVPRWLTIQAHEVLRLRKSGPLGLKEILRIGSQAAAGLAAAHAQGLVHRDIKPANILLENGIQRVKITDFGLARPAGDSNLTGSGVIAGTPQYMAPEQARGEPIDHRADLFSLGGVLYVMCTGKPPFGGGEPLAVLRRVCDEAPKPIRELNPALPPELAAVVERLLSKDPVARYQTAAEVADVLGRMLARLQQAESGQAPDPAPRGRRGLWVAGMAAALLLAGGAVAWYVATHPGEAPDGGGKDTPNRQTPPVAKRRAPPEPMVCTGHAGPVNEAAFSPDGRMLASSSNDRTVRLWDARTGQVLRPLHGHPQPVRGVAFAPDGKTLASCCAGGEVRLWDVATGEGLQAFKGYGGSLYAVAFAPDGTLAWAGDDLKIHRWDPKTEREHEPWTEDRDTGFIRTLAFAPDGKTLVSAGNRITFWDVAGGTRRHWVGFANTSGVAYGPGGRFLAATHWMTGAVAVFDPADGRQTAAWQAEDGAIEGVAASPTGGWLATVGGDGLVRVWAPDGRRLRARWPAQVGPLGGVAVAPDGKALAVTGRGDAAVKIWDVTELDDYTPPQPAPFVLAPVRHTLKGHTEIVNTAAFAPDSATLATGGEDRTVRLWDARTGEQRHKLTDHQHTVWAVAFSRDGKSLATAGGSNKVGELFLWDAHTAERDGAALEGHAGGVFDVAFAPDDALASCGWDRKIHIHDRATRAEAPTIDDKQSILNRRVGFTADGRTVCSCGDWLSFYDANTRARRLFIEHAATCDLRLSPRENLVAAAGWWSGKVSLYELDGGKFRADWQVHRPMATAKQGCLNALAFSPDGRWLVTTGEFDGSAKVWEVATKKLRALLLGHAGGVCAVAFAPDGRTLVTTGEREPRVLLWDVSGLTRDAPEVDEPLGGFIGSRWCRANR